MQARPRMLRERDQKSIQKLFDWLQYLDANQEYWFDCQASQVDAASNERQRNERKCHVWPIRHVLPYHLQACLVPHAKTWKP